MRDDEFLPRLEQLIRARIRDDDEESYTACLAKAGVRRVAQKVGEEGVEVALAGVAGGRDELLEESADLLYHLLVLLALNDARLDDVIDVLARRHAG